MTASHSIGDWLSRFTRHPPSCGSKPVTTESVCTVAPRLLAQAIRPSRTSRALFETGNNFCASGSSASGICRSLSKKEIWSASGHVRRILRSERGDESVTKRDSSTRIGRTLHRPPPLMRIFFPPSRVRSRRVVSAPPAAKIAAMEPAAPAPITTTLRRGWEKEVMENDKRERPLPSSCEHEVNQAALS